MSRWPTFSPIATYVLDSYRPADQIIVFKKTHTSNVLIVAI